MAAVAATESPYVNEDGTLKEVTPDYCPRKF